MRELAGWVRQAHLGDGPAAALALLTRYPEAALRMLTFATIPLSQIEDYERTTTEYLLCRGPWGRFWLVPAIPRRTLLPPAPMLTMRGLRALGLALLPLAEGLGAPQVAKMPPRAAPGALARGRQGPPDGL